MLCAFYHNSKNTVNSQNKWEKKSVPRRTPCPSFFIEYLRKFKGFEGQIIPSIYLYCRGNSLLLYLDKTQFYPNSSLLRGLSLDSIKFKWWSWTHFIYPNGPFGIFWFFENILTLLLDYVQLSFRQAYWSRLLWVSATLLIGDDGHIKTNIVPFLLKWTVVCSMLKETQVKNDSCPSCTIWHSFSQLFFVCWKENEVHFQC